MKRLFALVVLTVLAVSLGTACDEVEAPDARVSTPQFPDAAPAADAS
jgi:hypothetical protein